MNVREILKRIDQEKFRYWYDDTMEIGEDFRLELQNKIEKCSAFLIFISNASMQSKYCGMEIIMAFKNNKKIFPVYLEDSTVIPSALKMILENLQHVKGSSINKDAKYIDKLIANLPTETMRSLSVENEVLIRCKDGSSTISIPEEVRVVGAGAFYQCESLLSIVIPDSVDKIDDTAFRGCINLESIVISDSVTDFGWGVFNGCDKLHVICPDSSAAARYCEKKGISHSAE